MAQELDFACLFGDGVGKPLGICNSHDINTYSLGNNGNTLSGYDDLLHGLQKIVTANAPIPNAAIMHPRTLVNYSLLKDGDGLPLVKPDLIKNLQFLDTTKIPVNQVQGTSSTCSSIIMGTFSELVIGFRQQMEILMLQERYAEYGQLAFLCTLRADSAIYQPTAFCNVVGILPFA
jgi:HK97 family phage major capsid protein